jgi:hypothetical protein
VRVGYAVVRVEVLRVLVDRGNDEEAGGQRCR